MDLVTAIVAVTGPPVGKIIYDIWQELRGRGGRQLGFAANRQGFQAEIPVVSGRYSVPDSDFVVDVEQEIPILLTGQFIGDESFVEFTEDLLDDEDKWVIIVLVDQEMEDVYVFAFDFDGYAITIWPGVYSLYAFIVDPVIDDVLGFGYPTSEDLEDPNPIVARGAGTLGMDFIIFDVDELE